MTTTAASTLRSTLRWGATHGLARAASARQAKAGNLDAQLLNDPALQEDPFPIYERLRAHCPFARGGFSKITVHHDACVAVLRSDAFGVAIAPPEDLPGPLRQQLRSRGIPLVMLDPTGTPSPDVPAIGSADWSGAYSATRHLMDLGHRDIAIITGPEEMMVATARLSGFRAALESAGIPLRPELVVEVHRDRAALDLDQPMRAGQHDRAAPSRTDLAGEGEQFDRRRRPGRVVETAVHVPAVGHDPRVRPGQGEQDRVRQLELGA